MSGLTLYEITGQEAGIVCYDNKVIVCNWSSDCGNGGLPTIISPTKTIMSWPQELSVEKEWYLDDIRDALPGIVVYDAESNEIACEDMDILSDDYFDIPALWGIDCGMATVNTDDNGALIPTGGRCYKINDAIVIAPDGWI